MLDPVHLIPPDRSLFFSRNDPDDPRMGEMVGIGVEAIDERTRVAIVGVPQDIGVRRNGGRPGAADGPRAFRSMFYRLATWDGASGSRLEPGLVVDCGDIVCDGELERIHEMLASVVEELCGRGILPLVIGGGHDITWPVASGLARVSRPIAALNIDAHLDARPPAPDRNSGTSFRMLIDEGILPGENLVELGIQRFANAEAHVRWVEERGGSVVTLEEIREVGFDTRLDAAIARLRERSEAIYATLDLDAVRGADAPGVSAVMPDGLSAAELLHAARRLGALPELRAIDIAELNPSFDRDNLTAKLAAHAAMRVVGARRALGA